VACCEPSACSSRWPTGLGGACRGSSSAVAVCNPNPRIGCKCTAVHCSRCSPCGVAHQVQTNPLFHSWGLGKRGRASQQQCDVMQGSRPHTCTIARLQEVIGEVIVAPALLSQQVLCSVNQ